ncbi:hypothetical protein Lser_V15G04457 [Lactuca serriola]
MIDDDFETLKDSKKRLGKNSALGKKTAAEPMKGPSG